MPIPATNRPRSSAATRVPPGTRLRSSTVKPCSAGQRSNSFSMRTARSSSIGGRRAFRLASWAGFMPPFNARYAPMETTPLGFIGLGVMGEPMCRNLARKSGRGVVAWDPRREPLDRLAADGVTVARSVAEVARKAEIVLLSLPGESEIREVTKRLQGNTVVDCSTAPVALARELSSKMQFADAPVARTRHAQHHGGCELRNVRAHRT